tara:strand:+ start:11178 stop:11567 length:390 start_codon:yes stop_codon:yes gene_type:complete
MLRYKVRVHLGIFCTTLRNQQEYKMLVDENGGIPSELLYGPHEVGDALRKISNKYLSVDADWLDIRFSNIANRDVGDDRELHINYGVAIPEDLHLKSGKWVSLEECLKEHVYVDKNYHEILSNLSLMMI